MADATVLKTVEGNLVRVRLPSSAPSPPDDSGGRFCVYPAKKPILCENMRVLHSLCLLLSARATQMHGISSESSNLR